MKKLLSLVFFAVSAFAQNFSVAPPTIVGSVNQNASTGNIQQVSTPIVLTVDAATPVVNHLYQLSVAPVPAANGTINSNMFSFSTVIGSVTTSSTEIVLQSGQSANIFVNVDTSQLNAGPLGVLIFVKDSQVGTTFSVTLDLTVVNPIQYVLPLNNLRVVPQLATGLNWSTTLLFTSPNISPTELHVGFFDPSGNPLAVQLTDGRNAAVVHVYVPEHGTTSITLADPTQTSTIIGSIQVIPVTGYPVGIQAIYGTLVGTQLHESAVPAQQPNTNALTMSYNATTGYATGVALANSLNYPQAVTLTFYDENGNILTTEVVTIPANGQYATTLQLSQIAGHVGVLRVTAPFPTLSGFALAFDPNFFFYPVTVIPF